MDFGPESGEEEPRGPVPENHAKEKALAKTQHQGVQQAMDWLFSHEDDPDIDEPLATPQGHTLGSTGTADAPKVETPKEVSGDDSAPGLGTDASQQQGDGATTGEAEQAMSFKCDECGKLLKNEDQVQFHAAKTQHASFSESTEVVKPLSDEEKKEQLAKLQEKLKQKRLEREEQERKDQLQREKQRRTFGKDVTKSKEMMAEIEMKKIAEERRRAKLEEKLARQKVKEQIEKDKKDRAAKFARSSDPPPGAVSSPPAAAAPPSQPAASAEKKDYTETRLQIRLPNGQALTQTFAVKEPLAAVRLYVEMNRTDQPGNFTLMTSFPRKVFTEEDYEKPLTELGLIPSAVLMVTKSH